MVLLPADYMRLNGVHADLVKVVEKAAAGMPADLGFIITEGLRSLARQRQLFAAHATQTMRSRHLTGHAVDLAVYLSGPKDVRWDWPLYHKLAFVVKAAAAAVNVPIEWGGDWDTFKDGPHFQLPWASYPA